MSSAIKIRLWLNSSLSFGARRTSEAAVTNSKESCITIYCLLASKQHAPHVTVSYFPDFRIKYIYAIIKKNITLYPACLVFKGHIFLKVCFENLTLKIHFKFPQRYIEQKVAFRA